MRWMPAFSAGFSCEYDSDLDSAFRPETYWVDAWNSKRNSYACARPFSCLGMTARIPPLP
jgi:hypothetical protein